ncbi:MAG TPA: MFS transporter [Rhizomicrobium sp.]|jgi:SHS family lactate transporter-like MFS transporter|nr:MFS transporter [Rhizomicrobium sp.]
MASRSWTSAEKHVVAASFLGWMLDAFDFFLLVFVLSDVAKEMGVPVSPHPFALGADYAAAHGFIAKAFVLVPLIFQHFFAALRGANGLDATIVPTITLAFRPIGAFVFGRLADRFGRRPVLMFDVICYSALAFASAFAPNFAIFLIIRALFGIAMGGEWGIGASLTMETVRAESRGLVSGILQTGYSSGYLLASLVYYFLFPIIGWRGLFMVGVLPALMVLYIRRHVPESPGFVAGSLKEKSETVVDVLKKHWALAVYAILLMTCMNFLSHGTQDLYPTFLKKQLGFGPHLTSAIAVIYNIGAILGGLAFGYLSQRFGRRRSLMLAALFVIPLAPLWAFGATPFVLAAASFAMQFFVQGCWGVIPAHLNELSPASARGAFPGTVYQLGNFLASVNTTVQGTLAAATGGNFSYGLAGVAIAAALLIMLFAAFGPEARDVRMD